MTDAFIPKKAGDIILAQDWNEIQIRTIEQHQRHRHNNTDGSGQIDGSGIAAKAVSGSHIDPAAAVVVQSLKAGEITTAKISGDKDLSLGASNVLIKAMNTGDGNLAVDGNLTVKGNCEASTIFNVGPSVNVASNTVLKPKLSFTAGKSGAFTVIPEGGNCVLYSPNRMHVYSDEILYLLNKGGVIIGKDWGGSGALNVQGPVMLADTLNASGTCNFAGAINANNALTVAGAFTARGAFAANSTLTVAGALTANGALTIGGATVASGVFQANSLLHVGVANNVVQRNDVRSFFAASGGNTGAISFAAINNTASVVYTPVRMHLYSEELLYLLNKSGVIVSKAWGGNGNLIVEGDLTSNGAIVSGGAIIANGTMTANGIMTAMAQLNVGGVAVASNIVHVGTANNNVARQDIKNNLSATSGLSGSFCVIPQGPNTTLYNPNRLHVYSEELFYLLSKYGVVIGKEWGGNGNLQVQGFINGVVVGSSDARLKDNIKTLDGALEKVQALRGVSFDWKSDGRATTGLIAQEVEAVIPTLVSSNDDGMKGIEYSAVIPFLIEAIKTQQTQIDQLRAQVQALLAAQAVVSAAAKG